jgi:DNA-binding GntR family transcriptional regulator
VDRTLEPIVRASVAESVYQALRIRLMHGEYQPGQVLGIQSLADAMGTSTMPVREALGRLVEQQGLQPMRNGSTRVPMVSADRLDDIRRCRVLVEGTVTEWAAPQLRAPQLDRLARLADDITAARRSRDGVAASLEKNRVFHFTIYEAAGSAVMMSVIESLWLQSGPYLRATREMLHDERIAADRLHEMTVQALRAGDFAAARRHIENDVTWVFDRLSESPLPTAVVTPRGVAHT